MKLSRNLLNLVLLTVAVTISGEYSKGQPYVRNEINLARFGGGETRELIEEIYQIDKRLDQKIFGQSRVVQALKAKLIQYVETFGTRNREPISMHLVGLPGVGKSALTEELEKLKLKGLTIVRLDSQKYVGDNASGFGNALEWAMFKAKQANKPVLLVVEEIDKHPEVNSENGAETTRPVIGILNEILSSGKFTSGYKESDYSNVMVMTTMNLAPAEITRFSEESLGVNKSFYDYTIEDLGRFHNWITTNSSALPKILSRLFRSNTVSRLSPSAVLYRPLTVDDYRNVAIKTINESILRNTTGSAVAQRFRVTYTDGLVNFMTEKSTYAPSGARNTVTKTDAMIDQLIQIAKRATFEKDASLDRPRVVELGYNETSDEVEITITPERYRRGTIEQGSPWKIGIQYSDEMGTFLMPENNTAINPPALVSKGGISKEQQKPVTQKAIKEIRFPRDKSSTNRLELAINERIIGQEEVAKAIAAEVKSYQARPNAAELAPTSIILAGFPGIGKSELLKIVAEHTQLPFVRVNLQQFSSNESIVVDKLIMELENAIADLRGQKYILAIEELDKVFELNPQNGGIVNRPVMSLIKDLINDGQVRFVDSNGKVRSVDVRNALLCGTMNFAIDRFNFEADPRLTTLNDMMAAYKQLTSRISDLKVLLGTMFLPETVNRIIAKVKILKPLTKEGYQKLIGIEINRTVHSRLYVNGQNRGQIWVETSARYKSYLFSETVIPSEGARNTVKAVGTIVAIDLEGALRAIPRDSRFAGKPITLFLDFLPGSETTTASIVSKEQPDTRLNNIFTRRVALSFPSLKAKGKMAPERIVTAIHEFGHAFVAARLGLRFEYATVIPPKTGVGGYVKFAKTPRSATQIVADIYTALGSRAMERIFLSENPLNERSVGDITPGASADISAASEELFNALYRLGFDSKGGVINRGAVGGSGRANFEDLPSEQIEKLGLILRNLEDEILLDLLRAHSQEWYIEKISKFAKVGGVTESEFFEIIEYVHPGENKLHHGEKSPIYQAFRRVIAPEPVSLSRAREARTSNDGLTTVDRMAKFKDIFYHLVEQHLHPEGPVDAGRSTKAPPIRKAGPTNFSCNKLF